MIWIILLTLLTYSYCVKCGYTSDDNDQIRLKKIIKIDIYHWFVHSLDWLSFKLLGNHKMKWHLLVLGYHLISVSLFFLFVKYMFNYQLALVATLLFAIHPCNNQGVMWLSGRHYSILSWWICGAFFLKPFLLPIAIFTAFTIHPQGVIIPFILSFNKPTLINFLLITVCVALVPYQIEVLKRRLRFCGWPKENTNFKLGRLNMLVKLANYYLFMAFIPFWLGFYHSNLFGYKKGLDKFNLKVVLGIISLGAFVYLTIWGKLPALSLGIVWFFLALLPCMNIIHSNMLFSERYMYIPLMGFALALGQVILLLPNWQIILAVILTLYFIRSASYSMAYRDNITLYTYNTRNQPFSTEAFVNLGDQWIKLNRADIALPLLQRAVELDPEMDIAWFNLGAAQYNLGFILKAKESWEKSLKINPKYINPRFNLMRLEKLIDEKKKAGKWQELAEVGIG